MTRIIVDDAPRSKLHNFSQPLELGEESGKILARLQPTTDPSLYEGLEPQISKDELQRRKLNKGKSYTTAEVLDYLGETVMFRVQWLQEALDDLATIWLQADASLRQAVTTSAHVLEQELQADPFRQSESRDDDERVLLLIDERRDSLHI